MVLVFVGTGLSERLTNSLSNIVRIHLYAEVYSYGQRSVLFVNNSFPYAIEISASKDMDGLVRTTFLGLNPHVHTYM